MGVADLIPGISGGTIAFLSGIYEELLASIGSIQFRAFKKIAWPFLLPLGSGIACAFLTLAPLLHHLLTNYFQETYGFFFGVIAASTVIFVKQVKISRLWQWLLVAVGSASVIFLTSFSSLATEQCGFLFLVLSGALASSAMLLPGISGSYILFLLGIYPLAIAAIAERNQIFTLLFPLLIGIVFGLLVFARVVSFFLKKFKGITLSLLTGFMVGGLQQIWPFSHEKVAYPILFALSGFIIVICLEYALNKKLKQVE